MHARTLGTEPRISLVGFPFNDVARETPPNIQLGAGHAIATSSRTGFAPITPTFVEMITQAGAHSSRGVLPIEARRVHAHTVHV